MKSSFPIRLGTFFLSVLASACGGSSGPAAPEAGVGLGSVAIDASSSRADGVTESAGSALASDGGIADVTEGPKGSASTPDGPGYDGVPAWAEAGANDASPSDGEVVTPGCAPTHGVLTFTSNDTFVVPACVTSLIVEAYAGGGSGGMGHNFASGCSNFSTGGGGGGSGGNYLKGQFTVKPGAAIPVVVAARSCGQSSTQWWAADGNISSFGSLLVTSAASGGEDAGYAGCFAQGEGGFTYGTLGDIGGNLTDLAGVVGGSGSTLNNDGGPGGQAAGPSGGQGGGYGTGSANCTCLSGTDGVFPGGGGGGGGNTYGACPLSACAGGCGAAGEVIVTW